MRTFLSMRKLLPALLLPALLLAGCGSGKFISGPLHLPEESDPAAEEVVVWHTYSEEETRVFENVLIPLFESEHPDIKIRSVRQPYTDSLKTAVISRATSGKPPDLVRMDFTWVPQFTQLGLLYPLSELSDFPEVKARVRGDLLQTAYDDGGYYGLPLNVSTKIAVYNRKLLTAAGVKQSPATLAETVELARNSGSAIGIGDFSSWGFLPYYIGYGGQLLSPDWSRAEGYMNSPASVQAIEKLLALYREGVLRISSLTDGVDLWNDVRAGRLFMIDEGPWFYSIFLNTRSVGNDILQQTETAPFPGVAGSVVGGEDLVILKRSQHAEAAWTFMKWMLSPTAQEEMFRVGQLPTTLDTPIPSELSKDSYVRATMDGLDHAFLRPPIPQWDEIDAIMAKSLTLVFTGRLTPQMGLDDAAKAADALLALRKH
ncbi:extracellular solute-binding protein [Gorillibacterium massiliense]|uniref:extracellular solute-binding protein n=1 Tax=Gorillibacterium massiliense TaxID=1280390 RepID=UPI0004B9563D|nr:extracellular solute-binding protein [Gorillibacterium massiliense]